MKKRSEIYLAILYDKSPRIILMIMLSVYCLWLFHISGFLSGIVIRIPMAIVLSFLVLNGNIQFQDIMRFPIELFSTL